MCRVQNTKRCIAYPKQLRQNANVSIPRFCRVLITTMSLFFSQASLYNPDLPIVKRPVITPRSNAGSKIDMFPFPCFMLSCATQPLIALWREAHRLCAERRDPRRRLWR